MQKFSDRNYERKSEIMRKIKTATIASNLKYLAGRNAGVYSDAVTIKIINIHGGSKVTFQNVHYNRC